MESKPQSSISVTTAGNNATESDDKEDSRTPICAVCTKNVSKYCCPRCNLRSCSLPCSKQHKVDTGCNGRRDRAACIPVREFNNNHLMNDYNYLREVERVTFSASRSIGRKGKGAILAPHLRALVYQSQMRGTQLEIMAPGMTKRVDNKTSFNPKKNAISWYIELIFPSAPKEHRVHTGKYVESTTISSVLHELLDPAPGNAQTRSRLEPYGIQPVNDFCVLLKKERVQQGDAQYYKIPVTSTLQEALQHVVVIEYPTFIIHLATDDAIADINYADKTPIVFAPPENNGKRKKGGQGGAKGKRSRPAVSSAPLTTTTAATDEDEGRDGGVSGDEDIARVAADVPVEVLATAFAADLANLKGVVTDVSIE